MQYPGAATLQTVAGIFYVREMQSALHMNTESDLCVSISANPSVYDNRVEADCTVP